eukprot:243498-Rhodomonas_salina.2
MVRVRQCAIQVFVIGVVSLKWEEDSWLATGPHRPARICCQGKLRLTPLSAYAAYARELLLHGCPELT